MGTSTEADFQEELDWVMAFCCKEIEALDLIFPGAVKPAALSVPRQSPVGVSVKRRISVAAAFAFGVCR